MAAVGPNYFCSASTVPRPRELLLKPKSLRSLTPNSPPLYSSIGFQEKTKETEKAKNNSSSSFSGKRISSFCLTLSKLIIMILYSIFKCSVFIILFHCWFWLSGYGDQIDCLNWQDFDVVASIRSMLLVSSTLLSIGIIHRKYLCDPSHLLYAAIWSNFRLWSWPKFLLIT